MAVSSTQRSREILNATYELEELVASRSTHEVYRARDLRDGSAVWVQRPSAELARRPNHLARFATRAHSLEALAHRCLPRVCVDTDDTGVPFVVQELVEGRPLADLIAAFPQGVPLPLMASVAVPLIEALALAHAAGVIHGAVDPAHVMLLGPLHDPSARLIGLDVLPHELSVQDRAYRAPELASGAAREPTADVFACGVLLYHMLSGVFPFQAGTRSAVPLDELAPGVSAGFVQLTAACLSEDPKQRPADAGALHRRLLVCCDIAPRRSAAPMQATRPDTGVQSERVAPRISGRSPRARPADGTQRTAATAQRAPQAAPAPLASERVRKKAPEKDGSRAALSAQQAAELLSAKRDATSKLAQRVSEPAQRVSEPAPRVSQPGPRMSERAPRVNQPAPRVSQPGPRMSEPAPRMSEPAPRVSKPAPRVSEPSPRVSEPSPRVSEPARKQTPQPTAASPSVTPRPSRPSVKPAPIELTQAQLDALAFLRHRYDEQDERDRWIAVLFALLLLLLLTVGTPFFLDSGLAVAHATFGPKLRLAASAFSIATVIGALHPLVARAGRHWFVQRLRGAVLQATALDFVVISASLYSSAPGVTLAADIGQRWLPWGVGLGLLLFALEYLLRGLRNLAHDMRYAALVLAMAFLGCFGSYRAVMRAITQEKQRAALLLAKTKPTAPGEPAAMSGTSDAQTVQPGQQPPAGDRGLEAQRSGLGDNEAHDLAPAQNVEQAHRRDGAAMDRLQQKLTTSE